MKKIFNMPFSYVLSDEGERYVFLFIGFFCKVLEHGIQKTIITNGF